VEAQIEVEPVVWNGVDLPVDADSDITDVEWRYLGIVHRSGSKEELAARYTTAVADAGFTKSSEAQDGDWYKIGHRS